MTDQTQDLQAQLAALQAQMAALLPVAQTPAHASPWAAPAVSAAPVINGAAVPIKLQTPQGSLRVYLSLPAECAATPQALMSAIEALAALGLPLDTWQPKSEGSGSNWGSNSNNRNNWRR